jgi:AcrR family transcriptional regulator
MTSTSRKKRRDRRPQVGARERLLDAAEKLFADYGFNGTSVRRIVTAAIVNLGAVPYHFGTKENLFKEVIYRRAAPLRVERETLLRRLKKTGKKLELEDVLWAMLEPAFRASAENESYRRLLGRASMDPTPEVQKLMAEIYTLDFMVVPHELRKACAGLSDEIFYWRLNCFYGVMLFVQADTGKIQTIAGKDFDTSRPDIALKHVIPFLAAGFRCPPAGKTLRVSRLPTTSTAARG